MLKRQEEDKTRKTERKEEERNRRQSHTGTLLLAEADRLLHRPRQLLLERLVVLVRRQVDTVEARVALRQLVRVSTLLNREPPWAIRALQVLEAVDRNPRRARRELQQPALPLWRPAPHTLPEPLHDLVVDLVPTVVRELDPVIAAGTIVSDDPPRRVKGDLHIDLGHTADEQLQLALVKYIDQVLRNELAEARHERVKLLLDAPGDAVLDDEVHVFLLVLLRDGDVRAAGLELDSDHLSEAVLGRGERLVNDIRDVVLTAKSPRQHRLVKGQEIAKTHSIHVRPRCNSASTLSKSASVTFLRRIIL